MCPDHPRLPYLAMHAAQHSPYPGDQFTRGKWLSDVIVRADLQPDQPIRLGITRREHDDRYIGIAAQYAAYIDAIHAGQVQIKHDEIGFFVAGRSNSGCAIASRNDAKGRL